ncbi:hypothetical protein PybrP1_008400 [[Pythium] brassicae (nom. inval.)]|nr:hypothetical protein PybrP1_008400 [[Pythium] brassicae (nom. inval.)]
MATTLAVGSAFVWLQAGRSRTRDGTHQPARQRARPHPTRLRVDNGRLRDRHDLLAKDVGAAIEHATEIKNDLDDFRSTAVDIARTAAAEASFGKGGCMMPFRKIAKPPGRQRVRGAGRKEKQHVLQAYEFEHKLSAAAFLDSMPEQTQRRRNKSTSGSASELQIEERASSAATTHGRHQRATGIGTTLPHDAERELSERISDLRKEGIPVSAKMPELRALEMARELDIPVGTFAVSWRWRRGFLRCHRLALWCKTHQGQLTTTEADKIEEDFYAHLQSVVRDKGIVKVLNADQTGVAFEYLLKRVISEAGKRAV